MSNDSKLQIIDTVLLYCQIYIMVKTNTVPLRHLHEQQMCVEVIKYTSHNWKLFRELYLIILLGLYTKTAPVANINILGIIYCHD